MDEGNAGSLDEARSLPYNVAVFLALAVLIGLLALLCTLYHGYRLEELLHAQPGRHSAAAEERPIVVGRFGSAVS
jgi:hypothetical protein